MSEFNNRIAAQRHVLQLVNKKRLGKEELFGLSNKAIERWISVNFVNPESRLVYSGPLRQDNNASSLRG